MQMLLLQSELTVHEFGGFVEYKEKDLSFRRAPGASFWRSRYPKRYLRLDRNLLRISKSQEESVRKAHVVELHEATLQPLTGDAAAEEHMRKGEPLYCFTVGTRTKKRTYTLCASKNVSHDLQNLLARYIVDAYVGMAPMPSKWVDAILKLKCDGGLPENGSPHLMKLQLPEGLGELRRLAGVSRSQPVDPAAIEWSEIVRGRFSRGVHGGVGSQRKKHGVSSVGHFHYDQLSFGLMELRAFDVLRSTSMKRASDVTTKSALFADPKHTTFTGFILATPDGFRWPAHVGTLTDSQSRVKYWGQFALWLPWGLGTWCDYETETMFRGVLKKEYQDGHFIFEPSAAREVLFVPLMTGELMRLENHRPILDDEVLGLGKEKLPAALEHARKTMFASATPKRTGGDLDVVCASKALFQWSRWLDTLNRLANVWTAISADTDFSFMISVTATDGDVFRPGRDTQRLLREHVEQVKLLRRHLQSIVDGPPRSTERKWHDTANHNLKASVDVLAKAVSLGKDFEQDSSYWIHELKEEPKLLHIVHNLNELGKDSYMYFDSVSSMLETAHQVLDSATSQYCTLCFNNAASSSSPVSGGSRGDTGAQVVQRADLSVKATRVRGNFVKGNAKSVKFRLEVSLVNGADDAKADASLETAYKSAKLGQVEWTNGSFHFTGWQHRIEAGTKLRLLLRAHLIQRESVLTVASWTGPLKNQVGKRGDFEWVKMEVDREAALELARAHGTPRDAIPRLLEHELLIEARVAIHLLNVDALSFFGGDDTGLLPAGCGSSFPVRRLIENNDRRLKSLNAEVELIQITAKKVAASVDEENFEFSSEGLSVQQKLAVSLDRDPPQASIEEDLHDDVFGVPVEMPTDSYPRTVTNKTHVTANLVGGIFSHDGPSVQIFTEADDTKDDATDAFYMGPKYFRKYVMLTNPSAFAK
jgi:hypothetical protein